MITLNPLKLTRRARESDGIRKNGEGGGITRLSCMAEIDGMEDFELWVEVGEEWDEYLLTDRLDAFLVGIVNYAQRHKHDITCKMPVSSQLLYNLNTVLTYTLAKHDPSLYATRIRAEGTDEPIANAGGVGTGLSMGVDCFNTIAEHYGRNLGITHFLTFNSGVFGGYYQKTNWNYAAGILLERERKLAEELGLPLISVSSNAGSLYRIRLDFYVAYLMALPVMSLAKLFKVYLYSSSGVDYAGFRVESNSLVDSSHYDLLTLYVLNTENSIRFYSEGGEKDRLDKMRNISEFPIARKYLQSCLTQTFNCMTCPKCRRNLVTLDALDKLDAFSQVYDVDFYRRNISEYYEWMCAQIAKGPHERELIEKAYELIKARDGELIAKIESGLSQSALTDANTNMKRLLKTVSQYNDIYLKLLTQPDGIAKIETFFKSHAYSRVIVYGNGSLVHALYLLRARLKITIDYIVEDNAKGIVPRLPESTVDYPPCDVIIIGVLNNAETIYKKLAQRVKCPICFIKDVFAC
jgi:hypothetical protein